MLDHFTGACACKTFICSLFLQIMCSDEPGLVRNKTTPPAATFYLYVDDVHSKYKEALAKGCKAVKNSGADTDGPGKRFWGDTTATVADPYGHVWTLATPHGEKDTDEMKANEEVWMSEYKELSAV